jgi:hypothetical protein
VWTALENPRTWAGEGRTRLNQRAAMCSARPASAKRERLSVTSSKVLASAARIDCHAHTPLVTWMDFRNRLFPSAFFAPRRPPRAVVGPRHLVFTCPPVATDLRPFCLREPTESGDLSSIGPPIFRLSLVGPNIWQKFGFFAELVRVFHTFARRAGRRSLGRKPIEEKGLTFCVSPWKLVAGAGFEPATFRL